jgi:acyl-CoA thioester hydrolase
MYTTETQIRVHYALTDQMGMVYHGHYAQFYEIARVEGLRQLGISYKELEGSGILLPVVDIHSRFLRPAKYDDLITVKAFLKELPTHHKMVFHHEIYNEAGELLNTGEVTLCFVDANTMKRCDIPEFLKEKFAAYFR